MRSAKAAGRIACLLVGVALLNAAPVLAAVNDKNANEFPKDFAANPALAALNVVGSKFYNMGRTGEVDQWLVVGKDGASEVIYKPVNGSYALIGNFFAANGQHLTLAQIKTLAPSNKELSAFASVDAPQKPEAKEQKEVSLGQQLLNDLNQKATSVTLGGNMQAPQIIVIVMPGCHACAAFWQGFRDPVLKGAVRLRVFPVAQRDTDHEREAAHLLMAPDPVALWDQDVRGVKDVGAATVDPKLIELVRANTELGERWQLPTVPYLLYRNQAGEIKVVQGAPANPQEILDDVLPEKTEAGE